MKRIIDIDEADYYRIENGFASDDDAPLLEKIFKNSTPIKTGHWIYDKKSDLSKCSICGAYCPHDELGRIETYYCSCCGAKMESEDK